MKSRVKRLFFLLPALLFLGSTTWLGQWSSLPEDALNLPRVPWSAFRLKNGLQVIFHIDRSTPLAATYIVYRAGSQHDPPQRTGLAHLTEHMMFQETEFVSWASGGHGSTGVDYARYSTMGEAGHLPFTLWAEAYRMGYLRHRLSEKGLKIERNIVLNERREKFDSRLYGLSWKLINEALYSPGHPYHQLTIGRQSDIEAASLHDVKGFLRRYYAPDNAILVIAGNFDPVATKALVTNYFSTIPASPRRKAPEHKPLSDRAARPVVLKSAKRITVRDRVPWPRLYMVWPTGTDWSRDEAPLTVLSSILESGARSRLVKSLMRDQQIARSISVHYEVNELGGEFQVTATGNSDASLGALEKAIDRELRKLHAQPPTRAETRRALNVNESSAVYGLQELRERAASIGHYTAFSGNPDALRQDITRLRLVQPGDIQRVARQYLGRGRVVLYMLPGERIIDVESTQNLTNSRQTNTKASFTPEAAYRPVNDSDDKPLLMQAKRPQFKAIELNRHIPFPVAKRFRLSTGLPVVVIERPNLPIVHARLVVKAGSDVSSPENPDLPRLTADMVTEGTTTKSALDISDAAQDISARLSPGGNSESSGVALDTLSRNLVPALELLADVVTNPTFPVKEFDILRRQELQAFRRKRSDNQSVAYHTLMPLLYGKQHPYGVSLAQSRLSLESMRSEDLRRFYSTYWRPNNATLFVVGDVKSVELQPQLERYFANWRAAPVPPTPAPALPVKSPVASQRTPIYVIDRPGASQSYICVGAVGVERASLDFMPLEVANMILGGSPGSRLAQRLRTDKGYTYYAGSDFYARRGAGPFIASTHVQADATVTSLENMLAQMRELRDSSNISDYEMHRAKQSLAHNFVSSLETPYQIASYLSDIVTYQLPEDYFDTYLLRVLAVTPAEIYSTALYYVNPSEMSVVIVGDRKNINQELQALASRDRTLSLQPFAPTI